jgi:dihydroorotate dehydrogenase electron transfer subunit
MLKAVGHIADSAGIPCQVSMEERMACGVGVCLGCAIKVNSGGYKMVCKDGPVFDAKEIAW